MVCFQAKGTELVIRHAPLFAVCVPLRVIERHQVGLQVVPVDSMCLASCHGVQHCFKPWPCDVCSTVGSWVLSQSGLSILLCALGAVLVVTGASFLWEQPFDEAGMRTHLLDVMMIQMASWALGCSFVILVRWAEPHYSLNVFICVTVLFNSIAGNWS